MHGLRILVGQLPFYVVIATANRDHLLSRTLESLSAWKKPSSYLATIVVENGTKGETEAVVDQFAKELSTRHQYVTEGNRTKARNHALEKAVRQRYAVRSVAPPL